MLSRSILSTARRSLIPITTRAVLPSLILPATTASTTLSATHRRLYHQNVIDHYENPRNVGTLNKDDVSVGTGLVGAPACGDVMRLQIQVDPESGVITNARFKTFGCGSAIASSSYATESFKIKNTSIAKELNLPPVKLHCSMLAEDAIKSAIKDYKSKKLPKAASSSASAASAAGATAATA
ncbi:Iron sulfur cluster assembly protein 1, mitochondrial [Candida viswanathii]|uniref:Iron sulfur cluster assembly protein 1, mitochondrial n=1 Tax=Candida viswanathii TaxID=5486 RepID=A0A367YHE8_9ASCO|nr:Iron sulfur cluster assembly protein 1, mitochondrial [Candida viswanathii]